MLRKNVSSSTCFFTVNIRSREEARRGASSGTSELSGANRGEAEVSKHERKVVIKGGKKTRPRKNTSTLIGQTEEEPRCQNAGETMCQHAGETMCQCAGQTGNAHTEMHTGETGPTRM